MLIDFGNEVYDLVAGSGADNKHEPYIQFLSLVVNAADVHADFVKARLGGKSSGGTSSSPTNHIITVGGPGKLFYSPSNITANVGDTVTFNFQQKNHTVTQVRPRICSASSYANIFVPIVGLRDSLPCSGADIEDRRGWI